MIYDESRESVDHPLLLNPGGMYTPLDEDWIRDYSSKAGADVALSSTLLQVTIPAKGEVALQVRSRVLDLKTGTEIASWSSTTSINRHDAFLEFGSLGYLPASRPFEKQPLGKAARRFAREIREHLVQLAGNTTAQDREPALSSDGGPCEIQFKVEYAPKHSVSKAYEVFVNRRDETLNVVDGVLLLHKVSEPLLIQLAIHDAIYKLPKQGLYQMNSPLRCVERPTALVFEIGTAGEGLLHWR